MFGIINAHPLGKTDKQLDCSHPINEIVERLEDGNAKTKCMFCGSMEVNKV